MASRRDQLQSHQFRTQRVIAALVMREADPVSSPLRRGIGAAFTGLMLTVFVGVGFGVYGLLTQQGSDAWKTDNAVVIERETGATFVYEGGVLHPMLNYTSALLATDPGKRAIYREPAAAVDTVPRGATLGIPGAPQALPDASHEAQGSWTLCTTTSVQSPVTTVGVDEAPSGGTALGDGGVLVTDPATDATYLVWHGTRYAIPPTLITGLFGAITPAQVGSAWLDGIPAGPDIATVTVSDHGSPSPAAHPYAIGDLLSTPVAAGGTQYWMVLASGLAPITELQKDIIVAQTGAAPVAIDAARATSIPRAALPGGAATGLPPTPPRLVTDPGTLCATFGAAGAPEISDKATGVPVGTPTDTTETTDVAGRVAVPPGRFALVHSGSGYALVTDVGMRFAIGSDDVLTSLGYAPSDAITVPANLLHLIPAGPTLDPTAAGATAVAQASVPAATLSASGG